jgi:hypothetical protein
MIKRGKVEKQAARKARLSAALRENLKRRKQQARDRAAAGEPISDRNSSDRDLPDQESSDQDAPTKRGQEAGSVPGFRHNRSDE